MQKLEGVVIHMNNLKILTRTSQDDLRDLTKIPVTNIFSTDVVDYLNYLSKIIFEDKRSRDFPDVSTFAFFSRKANVLSLKKQYEKYNHIRLGKGLVFHIAPSNVPVNFAYSMMAGLLAGNINIVKVPSKNFKQIEIITDALNKVATNKDFESFSRRIILVRYDNINEEITKYFSSICNSRVIWGGDNTVNNIRKFQLQPRANELTFSDRYSLCSINANKLVQEKNIDSIVTGFYNDTYLFDQNACTSPHLLIWLGTKKNVNEAKSLLWDGLYALARKKYDLQPIHAIDKVTSFYNQSIGMKNIKTINKKDNLLWRVELNSLEASIEYFKSNCGYFAEYHAESLKEVTPIINLKYQTLSYYGLSKSELTEFIKNDKPSGIDRIVPIGKTMDFSFFWDGHDLISSLSRAIEII